MSAWWYQTERMSSAALTRMIEECEERAAWHDENDRPGFAQAARDKAAIAAEELDRRTGFTILDALQGAAA